MPDPSAPAASAKAFVSTGALPSRDAIRELIEAAYEQFREERGGQVADYIPALAEADPAAFGLCVANTHGDAFALGDAEQPFSIQSVSKPFVFALVCEALGPSEAAVRLGVDATGLPFNSIMAVELRADRTTNPLVNSGAIATTSLAPGANAEARWHAVREGLSRFAGHELAFDERVYRSEAATNQRNAGVAHLLQGYGRVYCDADEATDVYTRQCSLLVTARDLAMDGRHPGRRGRQPAHRRTSGFRRHLPPRVGGHGHGRPVRTLGLLAVRRRAPRQERRERRHRHRVARQGLGGRLLAAARRGGQQRARSVGYALLVGATGAEPFHFGAGPVTF
jgi:glutaminase